MNNNLEIIKEILFKACSDFYDEVKILIKNEDDKKKFDIGFNNLTHTKILLFLYVIDENNIEKNIDEFLTKFNIEKSIDNYNIIKKNYEYFIQIKKAII